MLTKIASAFSRTSFAVIAPFVAPSAWSLAPSASSFIVVAISVAPLLDCPAEPVSLSPDSLRLCVISKPFSIISFRLPVIKLIPSLSLENSLLDFILTDFVRSPSPIVFIILNNFVISLIILNLRIKYMIRMQRMRAAAEIITVFLNNPSNPAVNSSTWTVAHIIFSPEA